MAGSPVQGAGVFADHESRTDTKILSSQFPHLIFEYIEGIRTYQRTGGIGYVIWQAEIKYNAKLLRE